MTTRVLLFDMHTDGHHLEYARELQCALHQHSSELEVEVLTTESTDQTEEVFPEDDIRFLYQEPANRTDKFRSIRHNIRDDIVQDLFQYLCTKNYDIVHLLHIDDILIYLHRYMPTKKRMPTIIGSVNGALFRLHSDLRNDIAQTVIDSKFERMLGYLSPDIISRRPPWNYIHLSRCLSYDVFDHLLVATEAGRNQLQKIDSGETTDISVVPDPLKIQSTSMTQETARKELEIDANNVLLFFGELRNEKGIDVLLSAIEQYRGPEASLVIAGRPKDIDPAVLKSVDSPKISVEPILRYIPSDDVSMYFSATDAVVLPYRRSFGRFRTSGVFQKACGYGCPVVVSDFGVLGRRTQKFNLGVPFAPGDPDELSNTLHRVLQPNAYNPEQMHKYAESQTYEALATKVAAVYETNSE